MAPKLPVAAAALAVAVGMPLLFGATTAPLVAQTSACALTAERLAQPSRVAAGEPISVSLRVAASAGCAAYRPARRAMVVLQPPPRLEPFAAREALATAFIDAVLVPGGVLGALIPGPAQPELIAPVGDPDAFRHRIERARAFDAATAPGASGPEAIAEALDLFPTAADLHDVIYYIAHRDAIAVPAARWTAVYQRAHTLGIELIPICLGGGCDAAAHWEWEATGLADLASAVAGPLIAGRPVPERTVEGVVVEERVDEGFGEPTGVDPPAEALDARTLRWTLPLTAGASATLRYQATASAWGIRPVAEATVTWSLRRQDGRPAHDPGRMQGAPVTVELPRAGRCDAVGRRTVDPPRVRLGDPVTVSLGVDLDCLGGVPLDVIAVLDVSGSMLGAKLAAAQAGLATLLERLAVLPSRAGFVAFDIAALERQPLGHDLLAVRDRVRAWATTGGNTHLAAGLGAAAELVAARRPDAAPLVVVAADGESADSASADAAARAIRAAGSGIAIICPLGTCRSHLRALATDPSLVVEGGDAAALVARIDALAQRLGGAEAAAVVIEERPIESFLARPSSAEPELAPGTTPQVLRWELSDASAKARYTGEPLLLGRQPTLRSGIAVLRSPLGYTRTIALPDPGVETYLGDGGGPCELTPRRTAAPSRVAAGERVTVTLSVAFDCPRQEGELDAILVVDHSDSMRALDRLTNAKAAVDAFLAGLETGRARVGLVAFSDRVTAEVPLTTDHNAVRTAVQRLSPEGGTAIGAALRRAAALIAQEQAPTGVAVVLLTDGREPAGAEDALRAAAAALTGAGNELVTICAGDCGPDLAPLASRPDLAFDRVDPSALVALFERLAGLLADLWAVQDIRIRDGLPAAVRPEPASYAPAPVRLEAHEAVWEIPRLARTGALTLTYAVRPVVGGRVALSRYARAEYRLGNQATGEAWFPIPVVDVVGPTATPTALPGTQVPPPTETPTAGATSTGTATAATGLERRFIPRAGAGP